MVCHSMTICPKPKSMLGQKVVAVEPLFNKITYNILILQGNFFALAMVKIFYFKCEVDDDDEEPASVNEK